MERILVDLGPRSYPVYIGRGVAFDSALLAASLPAGRLLVVSNPAVADLYLPRLKEALAPRSLSECLLPGGEVHKTLAATSTVIDALVAARIPRDGAILALGGGVVGDVAGFAAACYQRGIAFLQIPTTLLAQVDSSVGGKTGVNHPGGKNLIGAFHQPRAVFADLDTLLSLPERELRAGLAEVIKYGLIANAGFVAWLERAMTRLLARDPEALSHAVGVSVATKAAIVARDERESGPRALLNFGHTFGHAIEAAVGYGEWLHGEAVAAGMVQAAEMSGRLGWLQRESVERVRALVAAAGLPTRPPPIAVERALALMGLDKKVEGGRLRLVLLRAIGEAVVTADFDQAVLSATLAATLAAA
jgi:3-dehydroquinate synthase